MLGIGLHVQGDDTTLRQVQCGLETFSQTLLAFWLDPDTINHHIDVMFFVLGQCGQGIKINHLTIYSHPHKALSLQAGDFVFKPAFLRASHGRKDGKPCFAGPPHHTIHHLANVLCRQG